MRLKYLLIILVPIFANCSAIRDLHRPSRGELPAEYVERTVNVAGKERKFRIYVPANRDTNRQIPVMLYLHGSGSSGDDNKEPAFNFDSSIEPIKGKIDFIVVLPQCPRGNFWSTTEMATYAIATLDQTVSEFNGDETRLSIAGYSLGGYGALHIGAANKNKFAAIMPVAGGVGGDVPDLPEQRKLVYPMIARMLESPDPYSAVAAEIGQTPVWVFHGANDRSVPVELSRKVVEALKVNQNPSVRYTEYENEGHAIFSRSIAEPGFLEWLKEQKK